MLGKALLIGLRFWIFAVAINANVVAASTASIAAMLNSGIVGVGDGEGDEVLLLEDELEDEDDDDDDEEDEELEVKVMVAVYVVVNPAVSMIW